ncbi:MAG TPA: MASE1 domain-containing protein [Candidatus Polarisedimenticolaceae bacterium]|nr:MASE1 domain-containing protein [Candidatus Polarisedimenticolaceae bacterium]
MSRAGGNATLDVSVSDPASPWFPASRRAQAVLMIGLLGMYVLGGKLGLDLAYIHKSATAVWPPSGIALAAFLLCGPRVWPAIFVGAFLVNLTTAGTIATSLAIAGGNTLEGLVGAELIGRYARGRSAFFTPGDILRFVVLGGAVATAIAATVGTFTLVLGRLAPWSDFNAIWMTWWLGDATGAILLAPACVLAAAGIAPFRWTIEKIAEGFLLLALVFFVGYLAFHGLVPQPQLALCFPFPLWAAFRFGRRATAIVVLILAAFAVWGTVIGLGPFQRPSRNESVLVLQVFMSGLGVMSLIVAATVGEGRRVERELRAARAELLGTISSLHERTAELTRSNEALQQFAYAASHDLQEPARTIGNYAELLVRRYEKALDANGKEFLGYVVESANWMQQLLEGLLAYSRVGSRMTQPTIVLLDKSLEQALGNLRATLDETGARITSGPLPVVSGDPLQMVQLLQNIIGNAVKFRRRDVTPEIRVESWALESESVIAVHDNGIGFDPRFKERMFEIFQRLHSRNEYPGIGVGLAISRKIVQLHGGRIWAEPRSGGGSTFLFALPRIDAKTS